MTAIPEPKAGMVIRYEYLWARQYSMGWDAGEKVRPCAILAVDEGRDGTTVYVAPITHTRPFNPNAGILMPIETKRRLGLDDKNSWLMCSEVNKFVWPGSDLRTVPGRDPRTYVYGSMPHALLVQARQKLMEFSQGERLKYVPRDVQRSALSPG
jgi:hypothetical protein